MGLSEVSYSSPGLLQDNISHRKSPSTQNITIPCSLKTFLSLTQFINFNSNVTLRTYGDNHWNLNQWQKISKALKCMETLADKLSYI